MPDSPSNMIARELLSIATVVLARIGVRQAGYSNYKGLLQRVLVELDKAIDDIYPEGSFKLRLDGDDKKSALITVKLGDFEGSEVKELPSGKWIISIDTSTAVKEEVVRSLAHEVTHISQALSGFKRFDFNVTYGTFKKIQEQKPDLSYRQWYQEEGHTLKRTEHEAKLVGLCALLARDNMLLAVKELFFEPEYYTQTDFKKFVAVAYQLGATRQQIESFKSSYIDLIVEMVEDIVQLEKADSFMEQVISIAEKLEGLKMLSVDSQPYKERLRSRLEDFSGVATARYNIGPIRKMLE